MMEVRDPEPLGMHRRKPSKEDDEAVDITLQLQTPPPPRANGVSPAPSRTRVSSTPSHPESEFHLSPSPPVQPPSAGPFRTGFSGIGNGFPSPLRSSYSMGSHGRTHSASVGHNHSRANGTQANSSESSESSPLRPSFSMPSHGKTQSVSASRSHGRTHSVTDGVVGNGVPNGTAAASPLRSSFSASSHARAQSISGPSLHSPFAPSFSIPSHSRSSGPSVDPGIQHKPSSSSTASELAQGSDSPPTSENAPSHNRRHSRLHSRNLSVFFPRPGSRPHASITEDGAQELEFGYDDGTLAPVTLIPSSDSSENKHSGQPKQPGAVFTGSGFTFGGRPPPSIDSSSGPPSHIAGRTVRRGHHHKHSLSHNFFSFLEPGQNTVASELYTQPVPTPKPSWTDISPWPIASQPTKTFFGQPSTTSAFSHPHSIRSEESEVSFGSIVAAVAQFLLGAWMWISGQQVGSLSCTGLGYWVVFDSFGVAMGTIIPGYLEQNALDPRTKIRRPYGNARVETVLMFAQSVYLMFSSVYVCKETVEHFLLSAGHQEGHHHHAGDEDGDFLGINFPMFLILLTLISLVGTSIIYNNHSKLISIIGNRIQPPVTLFRSLISRYPSSSSSQYTSPPTSLLGTILSNPYVASPIGFCAAILFVVAFVPNSQHRQLDLILASVETFVTFKVSYRACVVLGAVLLQTSPRRGLSGGRMEAFLRAMREIESHPQVLHLPAPHIWQLTPSIASPSPTSSATKSSFLAQSLVVTLEIHVRDDLGDADILKLTQWAWERCVEALYYGTGRRAEGDDMKAEVTVGVVRG